MRSHRGGSGRRRTPAEGAPGAESGREGATGDEPHRRALPLNQNQNCSPTHLLQELVVLLLQRSALPKLGDSIWTGTAAQRASLVLHEKEQTLRSTTASWPRQARGPGSGVLVVPPSKKGQRRCNGHLRSHQHI